MLRVIFDTYRIAVIPNIKIIIPYAPNHRPASHFSG